MVSNRWAVSSVMTRQNQIPTEDGRQVTLALIPLWDMCNHRNGLVRLHLVLSPHTKTNRAFSHVVMKHLCRPK